MRVYDTIKRQMAQCAYMQKIWAAYKIVSCIEIFLLLSFIYKFGKRYFSTQDTLRHLGNVSKTLHQNKWKVLDKNQQRVAQHFVLKVQWWAPAGIIKSFFVLSRFLNCVYKSIIPCPACCVTR